MKQNGFLKFKTIRRQIFICCILLFSVRTYGGERREFYNGIRALGMGDAAIATVNDETALLVNPAGLGKLRDFYGTIFDPEVEGSSNYSRINSNKSFTEPLRLDQVAPSLVATPDTYYHARAQLFPSFVAKNFGFGILARRTLDGQSNTAGTAIDGFYRDDLAVLLGYNFRFWAGRIKLGFTGKAISRIEINDSALSPTADLSLSTLASSGTATEGLGLGADVGLTLAAPWRYIPTISAVVRDVGGTSFDKAYNNRLNSTTRPTTQTQDMDVAVALFPILANTTRSSFTFEYKGVLTADQETDKAKLYHGGGEINFSDIFFLRAGYNQKYWTAGMELASEHFQMQFATYGEEVGTTTAAQEDRRYALKFAFRF